MKYNVIQINVSTHTVSLVLEVHFFIRVHLIPQNREKRLHPIFRVKTNVNAIVNTKY